MSIEINEDTISGMTLSIGRTGTMATRVFVVSGLGDFTGCDIYNKRETARNTAAKVFASLLRETEYNPAPIPKIGDEHPNIARLRVERITPVMESKDTARVYVDYEYLSPYQIEYNAVATGEDISYRWHDGQYDIPLAVVYNGVTQNKTATMLKPHHTITISFITYDDPMALIPLYVGKLNSTDPTFILAASSFGVGTLLCTNISSRSDDNGQRFTVSMTLEYSETGWQADVRWTDSSGDTPENTYVGDATRMSYDVYDSVKFSGFNEALRSDGATYRTWGRSPQRVPQKLGTLEAYIPNRSDEANYFAHMIENE